MVRPVRTGHTTHELLAKTSVALRVLGELRLSPGDPVTRSWRRFCRKLARCGSVLAAAEGPRDFARRAAREQPELAQQIAAITQLYVELRYAGAAAPAQARRLRELIRAFNPTTTRRG